MNCKETDRTSTRIHNDRDPKRRAGRGLRVAVAELESVGLSVRTINLLETCLDIIWLDELLAFSPVELQTRVPNLGDKTVAEIRRAVRRFEELAIRNAWPPA